MEWEGIPNPRETLSRKEVLCAQILFLEGQSSLLCASVAAFNLAAVNESWCRSPDLSLSTSLLGVKAEPAPCQLRQLSSRPGGDCWPPETCTSALERVQKRWPSPEHGPVCTLRPSPRCWGAAPGTLAVWGQLLQGWYRNCCGSSLCPPPACQPARGAGNAGDVCARTCS